MFTVIDWANVPHATANASNHARATIQITGLKTNRTREILENASKNTIFKIHPTVMREVGSI
jgi:hypothetical protein